MNFLLDPFSRLFYLWLWGPVNLLLNLLNLSWCFRNRRGDCFNQGYFYLLYFCLWLFSFNWGFIILYWSAGGYISWRQSISFTSLCSGHVWNIWFDTFVLFVLYIEYFLISFYLQIMDIAWFGRSRYKWRFGGLFAFSEGLSARRDWRLGGKDLWGPLCQWLFLCGLWPFDVRLDSCGLCRGLRKLSYLTTITILSSSNWNQILRSSYLWFWWSIFTDFGR